MLSLTKTLTTLMVFCVPQIVQGISVTFDFEVVGSENGHAATGVEVFADMPFVASGIYPFNYINGGVASIQDLSSDLVVMNQTLASEGATATDLTLVFGTGAETIGTLDQVLTLDSANFVTGWADFANGFADPVPALQTYQEGPDSEIALFLFYGTVNEKKMLSGTFHSLNLDVTVDSSDPDLVVVTESRGEMTFNSSEAGYEDVLEEILVVTGGSGLMDLMTGKFAHAPGLTDPEVFQSTGEVEFSFVPTNGDFDNDGTVAGPDYLTWQRYPSLGALSEWLENYPLPPDTVVANNISIPEPSTGMLVGLLWLSMGSHAGFARF